MDTKRFKVAARSMGRNSFGLRGHVLVARDGEAWEVAFNDLNARGVLGDTIDVPVVDKYGPAQVKSWARVGGEIPRRLPRMGKNGVAELWGKEKG